jgi:hypothetical protein
MLDQIFIVLGCLFALIICFFVWGTMTGKIQWGVENSSWEEVKRKAKEERSDKDKK